MTTSDPPPFRCDGCGKRFVQSDLHEVMVNRQTLSSPAEFDWLCDACLLKRGRLRGRMAKLQAAADAGYDTWEDYRGEK